MYLCQEPNIFLNPNLNLLSIYSFRKLEDNLDFKSFKMFRAAQPQNKILSKQLTFLTLHYLVLSIQGLKSSFSTVQDYYNQREALLEQAFALKYPGLNFSNDELQANKVLLKLTNQT